MWWSRSWGCRRRSCSWSGIREPIAAASIGQVHRAVWLDPVTQDERAVAVKVQYPGVGAAIEADLRNTDLLGALLATGFGGLDPAEMVAEIKERLTEELDYRHERDNQRRFVDYYRGHPFIDVPAPIDALSHGERAHHRVGGRRDVGRGVDVGPAPTRSDRRRTVPLRVPQPLPHAGVQRRPASRQLPVPRRRPDHVPRLRARALLHHRRDRALRGDGEGVGRRPRRRRVPPPRRAGRPAAAGCSGEHRGRRALLQRTSTRRLPKTAR